MRFIAASLAAAVVASFSATALAETYAVDAGCRWTKPTIGTEVPANVPAISFVEGDREAVTEASLADASGTAVPTHLVGYGTEAGAGETMLVLDAPLVSGTTYRLKWSDGCGADKTVTFTATASAPLPTAAGAIRLGEPQHKYCGDGVLGWTLARELHFDEDPALTPFLSVSVIDVLVDGSTTTGYPFYGYYSESSTPAGEIGMTCGAGSLRTARVSVRVHVPNGPTLATSEVTSEFSCLSPPAGCIEGYDSGTSSPSTDAGGTPAAADGGDTKMSSDSSSPGCSASGAGGAAWAMLVPALAIGAVARRRKRR